MLNKAD